jgi:hypothetical protein
MSMIFPNNAPLFSQNTNLKNIPYLNIYNEMQDMTSTYIKSRIIQKNLVYLIGLSLDLVKIENKLKSFEYFGQYGKILKLVINKKKVYNSNGPNGPSYTCFVTYSTEEESSLAILSLDNTIIDNHEIKANYGTTKYCMNFLKKWECKNKDCIYLHKFADEKDIVSREIMNTNKDIFPQQRLMAIELSKILTNEKYHELYKNKNIKTIFPNGFSVYSKDLVIKYIKEKNLGIALNLNYSELTIEKEPFKQNNQIKNKKEEKEKKLKEKNNNKINIKLNPQPQNFNELIKHFINVKNSLNFLYKSAPKSRFNFVKDNRDIEIGQIVPSQINDFITQQFVKHSLLYKEEQNDISYYYFSLKHNSLDSNDSWSSLVSILNRYNDINENGDMNKKFYTY